MKPQLQSTVFTLLDRQTSQRQIQKLTGVDRKTIRRYRALLAAAEAKSPGEVTTGSQSGESQIPRSISGMVIVMWLGLRLGCEKR